MTHDFRKGSAEMEQEKNVSFPFLSPGFDQNDTFQWKKKPQYKLT